MGIRCETPQMAKHMPDSFSQGGNDEFYYSNRQFTERVKFQGNDMSEPMLTVLGRNHGGRIEPWSPPSSWICPRRVENGRWIYDHACCTYCTFCAFVYGLMLLFRPYARHAKTFQCRNFNSHAKLVSSEDFGLRSKRISSFWWPSFFCWYGKGA